MVIDRENECGFTLLEIIMVMMVMAILTVLALGSTLDDTTEIKAGLDELKTQLRYAQHQAMATSSNRYVVFSNDTPPLSYTLRDFEGTARGFPGESADAVDVAEGVTVGDGSVSAGLVVLFNELGQPFTDAAGTSPQSGVRTVATSTAGNVEIRPETGFIP